jgi:hypothetical protein
MRVNAPDAAPVAISAAGASAHLVLSPSQLSMVTECEMKWAFDRDRPRDEETGHRIRTIAPGAGLSLGTAVHTLLAPRWRGEDWRALIPEAAVRAIPTWTPEWNLPDVVAKAVRLVERHEAAFPVLPMTVATEWQFKLPHPRDRHLEITGYQDGLVLVGSGDEPPESWHQGLWIRETKTMGRLDRLQWLPYDPQVATYMWAARAQGFDIRGVLYDAIYTKEWVSERDPAESFPRQWLPYNQAAVDGVLIAYERAASRIRSLQYGQEPRVTGPAHQPVRNAGRACLYCDYVGPCHGGTGLMAEEPG